MDYSVTFHNLITTISINPSVSLKQARFVYSARGGTRNPVNNQVYPEIRGIEVFCNLERKPERGREILEELETALYLAEEIFSGLVAKTQCECYLAKPITCTYNGKHYTLRDSFWEETMPLDNVIMGGEAYIDDASFIDEDKNFHPMFHFYRAAKDETNTNDYRALNAWRFLEALYGKRDGQLVAFLISDKKQPEKTIRDFYKNVRCAVAHAELINKNPNSQEVILPRSLETQFDGGLVLDLGRVIKYLDSEIKKINPQTSDVVR